MKNRYTQIVVIALGLVMLCIAFFERASDSHSREPGETPELRFSHDSGVYRQNCLSVTVRVPEGYSIAYTTDGSFPSVENDSHRSRVRVRLKSGSARYLAAHADLQIMKDFDISELRDDPGLPSGALLCAALVDAEGKVGEPVTKVYFLGMDFDSLFPGCLVCSVITNPSNLLDYETGILASGAVYDRWRTTDEGQEIIKNNNWWLAQSNSTRHGREWERPCVLQIFDGGHAPSIEQQAGIRTQGGISRRQNQKSFTLYFRKEYGDNRLHAELFPGIGELKSVTLRSGGNNYNRVKYKDAMLQELVSDRDVTTALFRPAVLFLNGEYWGPYMLTEKISARMLHDHFDVDPEQVVVIKEGEVEAGEENDLRLYEELLAFAGQDLTQPECYRQFCSAVNVQSMADYYAVRIYIGDGDWMEGKNRVLWRTRDLSFQGGRWQFVLYDIEYSTGLYSYESTASDTDHIELAKGQDPLFAAAMQNDDFRSLFYEALLEIGRENYSYERICAATQNYDRFWRPLMPDFYRRFGGNLSQLYEGTLEEMLQFFARRYDSIVSFVDGQNRG